MATLTPDQEKELDRISNKIKALAHPNRIRIVQLLSNPKVAGNNLGLTVTEIYTLLDLPQAIASQHLITLKDRDVLKSQKVGTKIYYSMKSGTAKHIIDSIQL